MDPPYPASEEDPSVMLEPHHGAIGGAGLIAAGSKVQKDNEFVLHTLDHLSGGCTRRGEFRNLMDKADKICLFGCRRMVMTIAGRELRDNDSDNEEADRSLDVRPMGDSELLIGAGEEEVEPHGGRDRCHDTRDPVAQRRDPDDDRDKDRADAVLAKLDRKGTRMAATASGRTTAATRAIVSL